MEEFRAVVRVLTIASLGLAALQVYLTLNKLWIRRHERAVAESISIYGELLGLVPLFFLAISFVMDGQWEGVVDALLWMTAGTVTLTIGTGMWVEGRHGHRFWRLVKDAMALERTEVGDLARSFFQPSAAERIVDVLAQIAMVDQDLDDRERAFVQHFADTWGIDFSWEDLADRRKEGGSDAMELRKNVSKYLATSPPANQVAQLGDVILSLVHADEEVSGDEELVVGELGGMLRAYVDGGTDKPQYAVALVPQSDEQDRAIRSLLPNSEREPLAGGTAFVVGRFFSDRYAEMVCEQYRPFNVFTTVLRVGSAPTVP